MITVLSNLLAVIPINYAFCVRQDPILGNLYLLLFAASMFRHSVFEELTARKDFYSQTCDYTMIYLTACYQLYLNKKVIIPYSMMFCLHRYYLMPRLHNYTMLDKIIHVLGIHVPGMLLAIKV